MLHPDRLFPGDPVLRAIARRPPGSVGDLPNMCPTDALSPRVPRHEPLRRLANARHIEVVVTIGSA